MFNPKHLNKVLRRYASWIKGCSVALKFIKLLDRYYLDGPVSSFKI